MIHVTYTGAIAQLRDKTAIAVPDEKIPGRVLVQFDDLTLSLTPGCEPKLLSDSLAHGWHSFPSSDFTPTFGFLEQAA